MEIVNNLLLFVHIAALVIGMGAGMSSGQVAMRIGPAAEEARPVLWTIYGGLSRMGHIGLGLLILTGLIMVFTKYGGPAAMNWIFWLKMALVVVLIISITIGTRVSNEIKAGNMTRAGMAPKIGALNGVVGFGIILCAVFAFN